MVVDYYRPYYNYMDGIVRHKTYPFVYPSAILDTKSSYYQSNGEDSPIVNITFQKYILITHFALKTHVDGGPWMFPKNWKLKGCNEAGCKLIGNNSDPNYFNRVNPVLTALMPGLYNKFSFQADSTTKEDTGYFYVIKQIEFFGYTCDTEIECNGNILLKTSCHNRNHFYCLIAATYIIIYTKK